MPEFKVTYRDVSGKLVVDQKQAADQDALVKQLRDEHCFLISIEGVDGKSERKMLRIFRSNANEVLLFTRQLANLLSSGLSLSRGFDLIIEHTDDEEKKDAYSRINDDIKVGKPLSEALAQFPKIFSIFYVSMIRLAEASGALDKILTSLADHLEKKKETTNALVSIAVYPVILLTVGLLTVVFILTFVFPRIVSMFESTGQVNLPWVTKVLMAASYFLTHYGWLILGLIICAGLVFRGLLKEKHFCVKYDRFLYRIPWLGNYLKKLLFVEFSSIIVLVLSEGISLVEAVRLSKGVISNTYAKRELETIDNRIRDGYSLSNALKQTDIFPSLMVGVVAVGEETGELEATLKNMSRIFKKEIEEEGKRFLNILEPAIILFLALGIGFIVLSILLPIFQMDLAIN